MYKTEIVREAIKTWRTQQVAKIEAMERNYNGQINGLGNLSESNNGSHSSSAF